jgi:hypothetical protein
VARRTLTLHQVPSEIRAQGAAEARRNLYQMLSQPGLKEEQREEVRAQLKWASKWESLNIADIVAPPAEPTSHVVELSEKVRLEDNG